MTENQERLFSVARNLLTLVGGFFIGRSILDQPLTTDLLDMIIGAALSVAGFVLAIVDKATAIEKRQSAFRHALSTVGGLLVSIGILKPEQYELWAGVIIALIPIFQGQSSRAKVDQLKRGEITIQQLKGTKTKYS